MIPFTSDVSEEPYLLRELKYHIAVADCTYIVEFFGAFLDDVSYLYTALSGFVCVEFLPCISAAYVVMQCLSVRLSHSCIL